ncbi:MAG: hypothetical protein ACRDLO_10840, partial [Solirubrobacterales bacterium]
MAGGDPRGDCLRRRSEVASAPIEGERLQPRTAAEWRGYARDRLIESRLTPNAISITGLILNLAAAVLVFEQLIVLAGVA